MSTYSIKEITTTADRHKIYTLICSADKLAESIAFIKSQNIKVINIGKELATYIDMLGDYSYLTIDVYDYTKKLLDTNKTKINGVANDVIAIFNLGILLEPTLEINAVKLFKEFAKSTSLIIIWENKFDTPDRLNWPTQENNVFLEFSDIQLKKLHYEI